MPISVYSVDGEVMEMPVVPPSVTKRKRDNIKRAGENLRTVIRLNSPDVLAREVAEHHITRAVQLSCDAKEGN